MILSFYRIEIQGPRRNGLFIKEKCRPVGGVGLGGWQGRRVGGARTVPRSWSLPFLLAFIYSGTQKAPRKSWPDASVFLKDLDNLLYPS